LLFAFDELGKLILLFDYLSTHASETPSVRVLGITYQLTSVGKENKAN